MKQGWSGLWFEKLNWSGLRKVRSACRILHCMLRNALLPTRVAKQYLTYTVVCHMCICMYIQNFAFVNNGHDPRGVLKCLDTHIPLDASGHLDISI